MSDRKVVTEKEWEELNAIFPDAMQMPRLMVVRFPRWLLFL